jgi:hypothetical protein
MVSREVCYEPILLHRITLRLETQQITFQLRNEESLLLSQTYDSKTCALIPFSKDN